jgi:membrane protein DedA with SNARE-associated domain
MTKTKNKFINNKLFSAVAHVVWIIIISLAIMFLINELFHGSDLGKVIILVLISAYVIFSFARRFWIEKRMKKILDAIDITLTLVGGLFSVMVSFKCRFCGNIVGYSMGNAVGNITSQPHIMVFYLGILLLIVGAIRVYIINKLHSKTPK